MRSTDVQRMKGMGEDWIERRMVEVSARKEKSSDVSGRRGSLGKAPIDDHQKGRKEGKREGGNVSRPVALNASAKC